jgi:hypothetical protein
MKKLIILSLVALSACYYDNEEELYPGGTDCDTTNVTYTASVLPVIESNCKGCHSGSSPSGGILLTDYATISAAGNIAEGQYGSLYGVISHYPGNSPMPKNGTQLPDCTIKKIKAWIDQGTPNN